MTTKDYLSRLKLATLHYGYPAIFYDDPKKDYFVEHDSVPYEELQRVFYNPAPTYHDVRKLVGIVLREGKRTNMIYGGFHRPVGYFSQSTQNMSENIK